MTTSDFYPIFHHFKAKDPKKAGVPPNLDQLLPTKKHQLPEAATTFSKEIKEVRKHIKEARLEKTTLKGVFWEWKKCDSILGNGYPPKKCMFFCVRS